MTSADSQKQPILDTEPLYYSVFTVPNLISLIRLALIPLYLVLLFNEYNIAAALVFAVAAASDFIDGQVARRTHQVSRVGKLLDPAIDTILMITGVLGCFIVGRIPLWIMVVIFARELFLLIGGAVLLKRYDIRVAVIYPGKFATTFLFIGFAGIILNMPVVDGLGICSLSWLPGFDSGPVAFTIWFVYLGILLQVGVTVYYCKKAWGMLKNRDRLDGAGSLSLTEDE